MPHLYNDALDDQLAYDASMSFVGGQVSNVRSNLLAPEQYAEGVNIDVTRFGSVQTRRGTDLQLGPVTDPDEPTWENISTDWDAYSTNPWEWGSTTVQGVGYYDKPGTEEMVCIGWGTFLKNSGSAWSEVTGYAPNATANVEFAQLVDKVYMTDEANGNVHSYNGTAITDEGNTSTDPPRCKFLVTHTNRLFAAGLTVADSLACSDVLDGGTWDATGDVIRIGGDSGDPITGLAPWYDWNILVFKERSIYTVNADPTETTAASWTIHNIDRNIGCVSHRSIAQVGSDVFFLAPDGIRTVKTILQGAQTAVSEPISVGIQDVIDTINWTQAVQQASAVFWNNHYILSVPTSSSTTNNTLIVYNTITKSFMGTWTGWAATDFAISAFGGDTRLNIADTTKVTTWLDYVAESSESDSTYQDDGTDYSSSVSTRAYTFGNPLNELQPNHVEFEWKPGRADSVEVRTMLDSGLEAIIHPSTVDTKTTGVTLPVDLPFTLGRVTPIQKSYNLMPQGPCREIQFKVVAADNKMDLRAVRTSSYVSTMELENV